MVSGRLRTSCDCTIMSIGALEIRIVTANHLFGVLFPFSHDARLGFCVKIARLKLENALFAHGDCVECVYICIWAFEFGYGEGLIVRM